MTNISVESKNTITVKIDGDPIVLDYTQARMLRDALNKALGENIVEFPYKQIDSVPREYHDWFKGLKYPYDIVCSVM